MHLVLDFCSGGSAVRCPQQLMRKLLDGVCDTGGSVSLWCPPRAQCLPSSPAPAQSCCSQIRTLDGMREKWASLSSPQNCEGKVFIHTLSFSRTGEITEISLGSKQCCLGMGWHRTSSSYPLQCIICFCFSGVLELLHWKFLISKMALLFMDDCLRQCFPGVPGL